MRRGNLLVFATLIVFVFLTFSVSSQSPTLSSQQASYGSNFDTSCSEEMCTTQVYSYEKYFNREGSWEEIDESWYSCGNSFCTKDYYFNVTASPTGLISIFLENSNFTMLLNNIITPQIAFSPHIEGNVLTYTDILPNVDLRYQYSSRKLKEEIIIKQRIVNLPARDFNITFARSGNIDLIIPNSTICDYSGNCQFIQHWITENEILLQIPSSFLNNPNTTYPVIIDPTTQINDSYIAWNGYIEQDTSYDIGVFKRHSNPSSIYLGVSGIYNRLGEIEWNLSSVPDEADILNVTLELYVQSVSLNSFLNITNMEGDRLTYVDDYYGNQLFFEDIQNGTVYANNPSIPDSTFVNLTFNSAGRQDVKNALSSDKFNIGLNFDLTKQGLIAARDFYFANYRPKLIIQHSAPSNLTYDLNGNLVQGFGKILTYDAWNRLRYVNDSKTTKLIAEYFYDHEGNRVKKIVYNVDGNQNNETTYYPFKEFVHVRNTNGTIYNETYIYLYDKLIARVDNDGRKFFYHSDHLGSTTLVTNESGDVVEEISYLPYGDVLSGQEISRYLYTGKEKDRETEFEYYGARYYNSEFSRFLQPDAVISNVYDPQNLNHYSYVLNNPYKYTDPSGNNPFLISAGIGAVFGAGVSLISQVTTTGEINYQDIAISAGAGAVAGLTGFGIANVVGQALGVGAGGIVAAIGTESIAGAVSGEVASYGISLLPGQKEYSFDPVRAGTNALIGGITGGISGKNIGKPSISNGKIATTIETSRGNFETTKHLLDNVKIGKSNLDDIKNTISKSQPFDYTFKDGRTYTGYYDTESKTFVITQNNKIINSYKTRESYIDKFRNQDKKRGKP